MKLIPKFLRPFGGLPIKNVINNLFIKFIKNKKGTINDPWGIPHDDPETSTRLRYIPEVTIKRSDDPYYKMTHSGNMDEETKRYLADAYSKWGGPGSLSKPEMERLYTVYKEAKRPNLHYYKGRGYNSSASLNKEILDINEKIALGLAPINMPAGYLHALWGKNRLKDAIFDEVPYKDIYAGNLQTLISELSHPILTIYGIAKESDRRKMVDELEQKGLTSEHVGDIQIPERGGNFYDFVDLVEGETHKTWQEVLEDYIRGVNAKKDPNNPGDYKQTFSFKDAIKKGDRVLRALLKYNKRGNYRQYLKSAPSYSF